jgi:hypothetical protein
MFSMWLFHLASLDKVTPTCKYLWLIVIGILFPLNEKLKLYLLFVNYCEETSHLIFLNYHCRIVQLISLKCTGDCLDLAKPRLFWKTRGWPESVSFILLYINLSFSKYLHVHLYVHIFYSVFLMRFMVSKKIF